MFITFEGIDGSGKSTQLQRLAAALEGQGFPVLCTRDPGGTELGREIRHILLHRPGYVSPQCELFLFMADRAQHVDELIRPALAEGKIVLCDRFIDSTVAYQGGGRGLPIEDIHQLNAMATGGLKPDKTLLFDAPVDILLRRAKNRSDADRLEQEDIDFYERIRSQYLALAQAEPHRFLIVNAAQPIDAITAQLTQQFLPNLPTSALS